MSTPFNFEEEEEQETEVLQSTEEQKEIAQFNIPKKYLKIGVLVLIMVVVLV